MIPFYGYTHSSLYLLGLRDLIINQLLFLISHLGLIAINYAYTKTKVSLLGCFMFTFKIFLAIPILGGMSMSEIHITFILGLIFVGGSSFLQVYFFCYVLCKKDDHKQQSSTFKEEVPYYENQPNYTQLEQQNVAYTGETPIPQNYQPPCSTTGN